jgi:hypothetical protein
LFEFVLRLFLVVDVEFHEALAGGGEGVVVSNSLLDPIHELRQIVSPKESQAAILGIR